MSDQQNINNILAALAAQQRAGGTPSQTTTPQQQPVSGYGGNFTPQPAPGFPLPQPINSGSVDLSSVKPVSSGSVSIADAIAKARGFAAEKGVSYDPNRIPSRNTDPRISSRGYRRSRSPSRSPPRTSRDNFRDNYNPYRDERRGAGERGFGRENSFSPQRGSRFSPGPSHGFNAGDRSPITRIKGNSSEGDSETIAVEKNLVGLIIGRSGETLRKVENSTGARVQFMEGPESNGATRLCRISGTRAARAGAKAEIYRIIDDNGSTPGGTSGRSQVKPGTAPNGENMQIMVPDRTVGLIIGRGGETIRDLQERSGCHVNIVGENKSINGLRPVNLIGTIPAQQAAKELIMEIVESDTRTGGGGAAAAAGGGGGGGSGGVTGGSSGGRQEGRPGRDDPYGRGGSQDKINDRIMVPGDAVGMIIGKGGESVRDMQDKTGCKINVQQPQGRDVEREIQLVGSRSAIEAAKRAILEKVDAADVRSRPDGRSDRRDDSYGDHRSQGQQPSYQQLPPGANGAPPAAPGEDPYAAYGGYNNYVAMWYAALAQQQQQGQGEQPRPPGA